MSKFLLICLFIGLSLNLTSSYVYFPWRNQPSRDDQGAGKSYASLVGKFSVTNRMIFGKKENIPMSLLISCARFSTKIFSASRMNSMPNRQMMPLWPPVSQEDLENTAFANAYVKRTVLDPRQIRRLAKSAKQRLGIRLQ